MVLDSVVIPITEWPGALKRVRLPRLSTAIILVATPLISRLTPARLTLARLTLAHLTLARLTLSCPTAFAHLFAPAHLAVSTLASISLTVDAPRTTPAIPPSTAACSTSLPATLAAAPIALAAPISAATAARCTLCIALVAEVQLAASICDGNSCLRGHPRMLLLRMEAVWDACETRRR